MLDRYLIDDGLHLPGFEIAEDASTAAGAARFRVTCSCGRMSHQPPSTREDALAAHLAHVNTRTGPPKGPAWLPLGARVAILLTVMLAVALACYATGQAVVHVQDLTGATAKAVAAGSVVTGFSLAFGLMVAARHYIAPTRA